MWRLAVAFGRTRRSWASTSSSWISEQAVSREQALKMFTIWPAYAAFEENDKGSIEVGKLADFTVLSRDIMKIPEPDILKTRGEMTVIGGEIVYASWVRNELEDEERERKREEHDNDQSHR